MFQLSSSSLDR